MTQPKWTDEELFEMRELERQVEEWETFAAISRETGVPVSTIKSRAQKYGITSKARPGGHKEGKPEAEDSHKEEQRRWSKNDGFVNKVSRKPFPPEGSIPDEELILGAGKNPEEWEVAGTKQTSWEQQSRGEGIITLHSFGVWFKRRADWVDESRVPTTCGRPLVVRAAKRREANKRDSELVVIMSDFHAPYHDPALLETSLGVLADIQPNRVIINGDLMDFPDLSRHELKTLDCRAAPEECLESGRQILAALRSACPDDTKFQFLSGNHDAWLHTYIFKNAGNLASVMAPDGTGGTKDYPALSLRHLLQFDHLGIELVGSEERWLHSKIVLTDDVVVRHGISTSDTQPIQAIIKHSQDTDYATISGHTHRAGTWPITRWKADRKDYDRNQHRIVFGAEVGGL